jgi:hypothetical protein
MSLFDQFTEATLTGIAFQSSEKKVVLSFATADQSKGLQVTASQVVHFLGEDFREANIVDFVRVYSGKGQTDESLAEALTFAFHGSNSDVIPPYLHEHMAMVRRSELVLVDFVPVYGAMIMVLARDVKVESMSIEK